MKNRECKRVVVTGTGVLSPIGNSMAQIHDSLINGKSGIVHIPEWDQMDGLKTKVAGLCTGINEKEVERQSRRTMGRVAILSAIATTTALEDSGLDDSLISSCECGISFGSTAGSSNELELFLSKILDQKSMRGHQPTAYLTFMSHTCAANLAMYFKCKGPVVASCTACTSGSQGIGFGYQQIQDGRAKVMICGGAEEMHFMDAGIFDLMRATSTRYSSTPELTPRPFDESRDGLVVGEGAGTLILEEYEHAVNRGAKIYAEVIGFGNTCDGAHITNPDYNGMAAAMNNALQDAGHPASAIDHVNAHATATDAGDIAESKATELVFGDSVPVSAYKGYMGHTLGASGAIESIISILQMNENFIAPIKNLYKVDERCAPLQYVRDFVSNKSLDIVMNNNFAFGGINTSLIFKKCES
ncbi:MAG: beta-ketoacyl-ACP synthase [Spirochaetes bacterium]|jgi:3-oxoacyl-[acyl-carrier-protein] synthase II|nr:beta-ketoacyl-ACP synthase [Spirochaetota bacterium]